MSPTAQLQLPKVLDDIVELKGGMDQMTPTLKLAPGVCRRSLNFEAAINGGYTRIAGYERYDGRTSPSSVTFKLLPIVPLGISEPGVGATVIGATSGTTGRIIAVSGSFAAGSQTAYVAVTSVLGSGFQEGEFITIAGLSKIGSIGPQTITLSKTLKKQYVNLAADVYRALINAVPGVGPVRVVFGATFNGAFAVYAIRDADFTTARLYQATASGWVVVPLQDEQPFKEGTNASGEPLDGSLVMYDSTPPEHWYVANRIITQSGSWLAGTARGRIISMAGSPIQLNPFSVGAGTARTEGGTNTIFLPAGGSWEVIPANFFGQQSSTRVYLTSGASRAFEWDGTMLVPIALMQGDPIAFPDTPFIDPNDRPTHLAAHQNHLFLSIGSSYFHSGPGTPYIFTASGGGGEVATGDTITGFMVLPGAQGTGALAVMGRNHTKILYGTALAGPEPFDLVNFETETGAISRTIQKLDRVYYFDDRGVIDLKTAQDYGNFTTATITRYIQTFIDEKHHRARCSTTHRAKGQYRIFFTDGTALFITLDNGKLRGAMPVAFPTPMFCAWSGEDNNGNEIGLVGGTDGFVYQLDRGTSFDGAAIDFELLLNWNTMKSPRQRKTIHRASIEIQDTDYTELRVGTRLGPEISAHLQDESVVIPTENELTMQWDHFTWDDFWWDAHADAPLEVDVKGTAERVQYILGGSSDYLDPFTVTSIITHYIPRRGLR